MLLSLVVDSYAACHLWNTTLLWPYLPLRPEATDAVIVLSNQGVHPHHICQNNSVKKFREVHSPSEVLYLIGAFLVTLSYGRVNAVEHTCWISVCPEEM